MDCSSHLFYNDKIDSPLSSKAGKGKGKSEPEEKKRKKKQKRRTEKSDKQ